MRKAQQRILDAIDPVIGSLVHLAVDTGIHPRDRISASRLLIEMAGLLGGSAALEPPKEDLIIEVEFGD
jgi:hypothetical protein